VTSRKTENSYLDLLQNKKIARSHELTETGISRTRIRRMLQAGLIERVGRGLYMLPGAILTEYHDLAIANRLAPGGVICLLSALRFHGLTTQNPSEVWMTVDPSHWRPGRIDSNIRFFYMSGRAFSEGIEEQDIEGVRVRVYSAAKTVADCFKFRNKIGLDVAVEAVRDFRRMHPKSLNALWRFAQVDRVGSVIRPYLEALS
jgi:predicted transcriptional regulator of viral defense system